MGELPGPTPAARTWRCWTHAGLGRTSAAPCRLRSAPWRPLRAAKRAGSSGGGREQHTERLPSRLFHFFCLFFSKTLLIFSLGSCGKRFC